MSMEFWVSGHTSESWLKTKGCTFESALTHYKENLSFPASYIPSLSSVIASLPLNPLNYSHVQRSIPRAPSCRAFSEPFLRPSLGSLSASAPPPPSVSRRRLCKAHLPGWFMEASPVWTHTRVQTTSWYISNLALTLAPGGAWLSFYGPLKVLHLWSLIRLLGTRLFCP